VKGLGTTKKGAISVSGASLFMVQDQHPVVKQILAYRGRTKLLDVYAGEEGLERYCDKNSRIHTTLNSLGARTGRFSSSNPNLQNIPAAKDTHGLRSCFTAPKGQYVICLDFSQIEIRTMAILSKDPELCRVLCDPDGDIHQNTADQFHVARSPIAKQINFLMLYGGGPFALSQKLTLEGAPTTPDLAKTYIDKYDEVYGGVREFRRKLLHDHQRNGHCDYLIGRQRYLLDVDWSSRREMHKAETVLSNNINQGSAQDWLKASIVRGDPLCINPDREIVKRMTFSREHTLRLRDYAVKLDKLRTDMLKANCKWVLQVHDETLYFCDRVAAHDIGKRIAEMMTWCHYFEPITSIDVPVVVDGGVGENWSHAKGKEPLFKLEHFGEKFGVAA
jgi:DNA polymerase-1